MDTKTTTATKSLVGTQTEKNILIAYLSETQAYARYRYYAQQAVKENYFPIQYVFLAAANNELHHAKVYFKHLTSAAELSVPMTTNAGTIGDTVKNLQIAIAEEKEEQDTYLGFAKTAREEGFDDIASIFEAIASIEAEHGERFEKFLKYILTDTMWKRDEPVTWQCLVCGYRYVGKEPPVACPACAHPTQHYIAVEDMEGLLADAG
ncbi:MAG: rubrerythrin family protein [Muribaculum sp.]|nr:rubrerythrin family protein [Muribaculum sp.]